MKFNKKPKTSSGRRTTFDGLDKKGRSELMGKIKSKNTKPELIVRQALFRDGLRYRLHRRDLPGKPDISIDKYRLVVDIRGCFWHGHFGCKDGHTPKTNTAFWRDKLQKNIERDKKNFEKLRDLGFEVFVLWECEVKNRKVLSEKLEHIYDYLRKNFYLKLSMKS